MQRQLGPVQRHKLPETIGPNKPLKRSKEDILHNAILILVEKLGGEDFLAEFKTKYQDFTVTRKEITRHSFMFSIGIPDAKTGYE